MLTINYISAIITFVVSESGGIGRRARLRGVWGNPYGFKSRLSHQKYKVSIWILGIFLCYNGT